MEEPPKDESHAQPAPSPKKARTAAQQEVTRRNLERMQAEKAQRLAFEASGVPQDVSKGPEVVLGSPVDPGDAWEAMKRVGSGERIRGKRTPLEQSFAKLLEENPKDFAKQYAAMQLAREGKGQERESEGVVDEKTESLVALIDRLLAEGEASGWKA